jgi:hypothetical protein
MQVGEKIEHIHENARNPAAGSGYLEFIHQEGGI